MTRNSSYDRQPDHRFGDPLGHRVHLARAGQVTRLPAMNDPTCRA